MQPYATPDYSPEHQPVATMPPWTITVVSPVMFSVLSFATFGLYALWWQFRAWQFFKRYHGDDTWPFVRAMFSIFTIYELLKKIKSFAGQSVENADYNAGNMATGYILVSFLSRLPDPFWLLALPSFFFLLPAVRVFRQALLGSEEYAARTQPGYSVGHLLLLAAGIVFWGLIATGIMMK